MILDRLENRQSYVQMTGLYALLDWAAALEGGPLPAAPVRLLGDDLFINPVAFFTKPESECLFEAHRRYADVHIVLEGREEIAVNAPEALQSIQPYDDSRDIGFYCGEGGTRCLLRPGDFLVCFPHDAHKVAVAPNGSPAAVKKLVGKIRVL